MSLFIGRLSSSTQKKDLEDAFAKFGRVRRADVKIGRGLFI
jgi:RNA recognition motif-containing protein